MKATAEKPQLNDSHRFAIGLVYGTGTKPIHSFPTHSALKVRYREIHLAQGKEYEVPAKPIMMNQDPSFTWEKCSFRTLFHMIDELREETGLDIY